MSRLGPQSKVNRFALIDGRTTPGRTLMRHVRDLTEEFPPRGFRDRAIIDRGAMILLQLGLIERTAARRKAGWTQRDCERYVTLMALLHRTFVKVADQPETEIVPVAPLASYLATRFPGPAVEAKP